MRTSVPLTLFSVVLVAAGCGSARPPAETSVPSPARIELGSGATVDGVTVAFESVRKDSRCPRGVQCVWAGEAVVALALNGESHDARVAALEQEPGAGVAVGDRVVFATALTPEPEVDVKGGEVPVVTIVTRPVE